MQLSCALTGLFGFATLFDGMTFLRWLACDNVFYFEVLVELIHGVGAIANLLQKQINRCSMLVADTTVCAEILSRCQRT